MSAEGTYLEIGNRPALRFERQLAHPVEAVWQAIVDSRQNVHWYPARAEFDLRPGGPARFTWEPEGEGDEPEVTVGTILEVDPPRLLAFEEDGHVARYELAPSEGACTLLFHHVFTDAENAHRHAAGWHQSLDALADRLAGRPGTPLRETESTELIEAYRNAFASGSSWAARSGSRSGGSQGPSDQGGTDSPPVPPARRSDE